MTSKDGQATDHHTGSVAPDQVTSPPLQRHTMSADDPLIANLIQGDPTPEPPAPKAEAPEGEAGPETQATQDQADDPQHDTTAGEEPQVDDGATPDPTDRILKQFSQQFSAMNDKVEKALSAISEIKQTKPATGDTEPAATAQQEQAVEQAEEDLGNLLKEFEALQQDLDTRGEYEGVEPKDLKAIIKGFTALNKDLASIKAAQTAQAAQAAKQASQSGAEQFFQTEAKTHGIEAKTLETLWDKASDETVKYVGVHEPGTPGYEIASKQCATRYQELVKQAKAQPTKPPQQAAPQTPEPSKPQSPHPLQSGAAVQPRQQPKGTVIQHAGTQPAAVPGQRSSDEIIKNLIVPD